MRVKNCRVCIWGDLCFTGEQPNAVCDYFSPFEEFELDTLLDQNWIDFWDDFQDRLKEE